MKKRLYTIVLLLFCCGLLCSATLTKGKFRDLPQKEVFRNRTYPQFFAFRGEMSPQTHTDYRTWSAALGDVAGVMRKFVDEELVIHPKSAEWANRYAARNPEKLMMLHLNGEARQVAGFPEVLERYFPGHWVYLAGSMAGGAVKASDRSVAVEDAGAFTMRGYANRYTDPVEFIPQNVIMVRVDEQGKRLWDQSEYAILTGVDYENNTISLKRGQFYSTPLDFARGELYIAPIAGGMWGKDVMWYYNLSSVCPPDSAGKQAWELYADEIIGWFAGGGVLENFQGIAFDVNYFDISEKYSAWDVDNDGKADGGRSDGQDVWTEGDWKFLTRLRERLGREFILSADAQHPANQQAPGIMDGMESEGLVQHDDMWRGFSRAVNTHLYWKGNNDSPYDYRYVVLKLNGADRDHPIRLRRFGAAAASCLEAFVTDPSPRNYMPEKFSAPGSLGVAQGELVRFAKTGKQIFSASGEELHGRIDAPGCDLALSANGVVVGGRKPGARMKFNIKDIPMPSGDVTIFVKARAIEPLDGFTKDELVPRIVWLRPARLPDYGEGERRDAYYTRLYGMAGTHRTEELSYYFRRVEGGEDELQVEIQGMGDMEISSLEVYASPDVIARRFDNAIVVVNPSMEAVRVDVGALFGPEYEKAGTVELPPVDAVFIPVGR